MDIRQLKYFLTIIEEGSITKAAEKLHIAQPPLSHQLKLLEDELEIKLIERNTRKFEITDAGKVLKHRSKQILELSENTIKELKNLKDGFQETLSIGTVQSAGVTLLPERLNIIQKKHPNVTFQIKESNTYNILNLLNKGSIDIGIVLTPFNSEIFESILLSDEPMVAAVKEDLYFQELEGNISLTELEDKPLIIDGRFRDILISSCHQAGFEPKILCESEDAISTLLWARTGAGIGLIPKPAVNFITTTDLKYMEINELSLRTRTAIVWARNRYLSEATKDFLETFKA
ncbi:LysR family transcriptional regulator [Clostridium sp. DJ247]|uniref:LysR family transcriptional regulator n=1 Tax=Clostridium sp. DJ247 TaxID=2726188 RepID=UPI00162533F1|nr:LysR family transcriptional regulator [Clostridium sp. DJ247]MBC2582709.1 LysR family transcriptional regulator [Clostridium sp. DJ247]